MTVSYSEEQIAEGIERVAGQIVERLGAHFVLVPILTGGFIFAADLARALHRRNADPEIDFIQLSSYDGGRASSGLVKLLKDITAPVEDQHILLVDDVLDSGRSLYFAAEMLKKRGAASVSIAVVVQKEVDRAVPVTADFAVFTCPSDAFLVGYGMDDGGLGRAMPRIGTVD